MISSSDILHGKILIVDDLEANIVLLERTLRGAGYVSISSTMNPSEVCELHRKHRFDLILLDLQMPGMDGFKVMEELREIEPQDALLELTQKHQFQVMEGLKEIEPGGYLPVIVITAHPGHNLRAFQAGARDFISKPFELSEVLARVHNMLEVRLLHLETKSYIKALELKIQEMEIECNLPGSPRAEVKPRYDKFVSLPGSDAAASTQSYAPRATRLRTLLYVEDNPTTLKLVEQIIARHPDIRLLTAMNGSGGIEIARSSQPDVILMDINLPGMSGLQALKILRSDLATAHIPVIAVSGNVMPLSIENGLKAGFFRYITKPIKVNEFMEALEEALEFARKKSAGSK
jgi:CheY-like chemotaxis protein